LGCFWVLLLADLSVCSWLGVFLQTFLQTFSILFLSPLLPVIPLPPLPQAIFQQRVNQQTMPNLFKLSSMEKKKKGAKKKKLAKLYFFLFYGTKSVYLYTTRQ